MTPYRIDEARPEKIDAAFALASQYYREGMIDAALEIYREINRLQPENPRALHARGVIAFRSGNAGEAAELIGRAVAIQPDFVDAHNNLGNVFRETGRLAEAEVCYRNAVASAPGLHVAYFNLGNILLDRNQPAEAVAVFEKMLELQADDPEILRNLGIALKAAGRVDDAVAAYRRSLELNPGSPVAWYNLGNALADLEDPAGAEEAFRRTLALQPDSSRAWNNLGNLLVAVERTDEGAACYRRALEIEPEYPEALVNLGAALNRLGRSDEALEACRSGIGLRPDDPEGYNSLGVVLRDRGEQEAAVAALEKAIALRPNHAKAWNNLGLALRDMGLLERSAAAYRKAILLREDYAEAYSNLGIVLLDAGQVDEAVATVRKALELRPDLEMARSNLILFMNYSDSFSPADIHAESRRWGELHGPAGAPAVTAPDDSDPERRLRVGYVSPDFRRHSVAYFVEPLLAAHDRKRYEIFCYADVVSPDDVTARLRGLEVAWRDIAGLRDDAVCAMIRSDRIDILVDLAGHTGRNRLRLFVARPAPLQATWLGYPNTTGLEAVDYRITDAVADPPGPGDAFYAEEMLRPEGCFLCYSPPAEAPAVGPLPASKRGFVTFGSFNNLAKVTPEAVALWARLLAEVSGSRLVMKNRSLADGETRERFLALMARHGIDTARLELRSWAASTAEHLAGYGEIDVSLDTFPYNGTTTTCESLWMGVPVIALRGDRHAARVSASILRSLGLEELVAATTDDYLAKAVALTRDLPRLASLRSGLRTRMSGSSLCDPAAFAARIEGAFREIWLKRCRG